MTYEVSWTQWFFDLDGEKDCEIMFRNFETLEEAEKFVDDLCDHASRFFGNLNVYRDDTKITVK